MNVQLKEGQEYTDDQSQYSYNKGFGRIRNLNFVIISGSMSDPENFVAQAGASIVFYNDANAAIEGVQPLYRIELNFSNLEIISILDIDAKLGYSISEKKIYDSFLSVGDNAEKFELI